MMTKEEAKQKAYDEAIENYNKTLASARKTYHEAIDTAKNVLERALKEIVMIW